MATAKAAKKSPIDESGSSRRKRVIEAADASRLARVAYMTVLGRHVTEESLTHLSPEARKIAHVILGRKTGDPAAREVALQFRQWARENAGPGIVPVPKSTPRKASNLGKKAG
jgi:hypothetical protein